jgi:hypothetical protein
MVGGVFVLDFLEMHTACHDIHRNTQRVVQERVEAFDYFAEAASSGRWASS